MGMAGGHPRVASDVDVVDEKGAALLNRIHREGGVTGTPPDSSKGLDLVGADVGIGLVSDKFTIRSTPPKVGTTGMEESTGEGAKGSDQLTGITTLKGGTGKFQQKLLEGFVRLRLVAGLRISGVSSQCPPITRLSG